MADDSVATPEGNSHKQMFANIQQNRLFFSLLKKKKKIRK